MPSFLTTALVTIAALLPIAGLLHLIPRLGSPGRRLSDACCRAPLLDWIITYFTVAPLFVGPIVAGWRGFLGAAAGQVATVLIWTFGDMSSSELSAPRVAGAASRADKSAGM